MEIRKGDRFYCFKDLKMKQKGNIAYTKGKIYESDEDWNLPDDDCMYHTWHNQFGDEHDVLKDHFAKIGQYKGDLEGFPELIVEWMFTEQELQGNKRDLTVFEGFICSSKQHCKGFDWEESKYFDRDDCDDIIRYKNFQIFFDKYPQGILKELTWGEAHLGGDFTEQLIKDLKETVDMSTFMSAKINGETFVYSKDKESKEQAEKRKEILERHTEESVAFSKAIEAATKTVSIQIEIISEKQKIKRAKAKIKKLKKNLKPHSK